MCPFGNVTCQFGSASLVGTTRAAKGSDQWPTDFMSCWDIELFKLLNSAPLQARRSARWNFRICGTYPLAIAKHPRDLGIVADFARIRSVLAYRL